MFYLIRHGSADYTEKDAKIYQGFGNHLAPLSAKGMQEIEMTAADPRLAQARLIFIPALHPCITKHCDSFPLPPDSAAGRN